MNKEPIGLYIFRFILGFGLFAFMAMLYWSSLLLEKDMKDLQNSISTLRDEMLPLKEYQIKILDRFDQTKIPVTDPVANPQEDIAFSGENLLKEDPFFEKTLPTMLPKDFKPEGVLKRATYGKPSNLHPFSNWKDNNEWQALCIPSLAKTEFGKYETLSPDLAMRIEEKIIPGTDIPEYWVYLRKDVFWAPLEKKFFPSLSLSSHFFERHPVTSEDFKFFFDAMMNPYVQEAGAVSLRTYFEDLKEIEIVDDHIFIVRWKAHTFEEDGKKVSKIKYISKQLTSSLRPLASFVYKYFYDGKKIVESDEDKETYRKNSVWAQNFSEHWAKNIIPSCGAWLFDGMSDREIRFKRNPNFYNPYGALASQIIYTIKSSPEAVWQSFKNAEEDSYEIPPDQLNDYENFLNSSFYLSQADRNLSINRLDYLDKAFAYIGWNQARPLFKSKKVRQALTMAIDRQRIIQQNLNGMGESITGPFYKYSPSYDGTIDPWPFDPFQAKRLLEEEGWFDTTRSGILDKLIDGKRVSFRFSLTYFVKNSLTKSICEYISTALKEIGVQCELNGLDLADLSAKFESKDFDALFMLWGVGSPPEIPRQLWHSSGATQQGSSNMIGFSNKEADKIIDLLDYEYNKEKRLKLYHQFHQILHEEQPYTFLYTPQRALIYRNYLQNVFLPIDRQDLIPGANVSEPDPSIFWIRKE